MRTGLSCTSEKPPFIDGATCRVAACGAFACGSLASKMRRRFQIAAFRVGVMFPDRTADDAGALVATVGERTDRSVKDGVAGEAMFRNAAVQDLAGSWMFGDGHGAARLPGEAATTVRMIGLAVGLSAAAVKLRRGSNRIGTISG
jgi:hypothetical protein